MKKTAAIALALVLMLTLLAACGSGNNKGNDNGGANNAAADNTAAPDNAAADNTAAGDNAGTVNADIKGTVTFLSNRTDMVDKEYNDYKERFEAKYPGVELKFETIANDYEAGEKVRIASGKFPDIVLLSSGIPVSDYPKYFEPLDDIQFSGDIWFKDLKAYEGKMYGVSSGGNTSGIVYNKQAFAKAGITEVPKTLDEFLAACQKLKDAGIVPLASNFKDKWPLGNWSNDVTTMLTGDADYLNKRKESDAPYGTDSAFYQSWSILRDMKEKGFLEKDINSTNWEQSKKDIASGKFAMYLLGNWVINQVIGAGAKSEDVGFFPFPADNSGKHNAPLGPDWFYAVNKDGNVPAAKAFVKWMIEESGYDDFAGFIPTLKDKDPKLEQLNEFKSYNPTFIEAVATDDKTTQIQNKAQIDQDAYLQEFVLAKDPQKVIDKLNAAWAKARKEIG